MIYRKNWKREDRRLGKRLISLGVAALLVTSLPVCALAAESADVTTETGTQAGKTVFTDVQADEMATAGGAAAGIQVSDDYDAGQADTEVSEKGQKETAAESDEASETSESISDALQPGDMEDGAGDQTVTSGPEVKRSGTSKGSVSAKQDAVLSVSEGDSGDGAGTSDSSTSEVTSGSTADSSLTDEKHAQGVFEENGAYYYYDADGNQVTTEGLITWSDKVYYVEAGGKLAVDKQVTVDPDWYYFGTDAAAYQDKVFAFDGAYYYAQPDGKVKQTAGWIKIASNGKKYYAADGGQLYCKKLLKTGKKKQNWYYFSKKGVLYTDKVVKIKGKYYYAQKNSGKFLKKKGWIETNGKKYYAGKKGVLYQNQLLKTGDNQQDWYYFGKNAAMVTKKVVAWEDNYYYAGKDGRFKTNKGWVKVGKKRYYAGKDGVLLAKQMLKTKKGWYYFAKNAKMKKGKIVSWEKNYYYLDPDTGRVVDTVGWLKLNGKKYYVTSSKALARNSWQQIGKKWYHFNKKGVYDKKSNTRPLDAMDTKAQKYRSSTSYLILVNRDEHTVRIYTGSEGSWTRIKSFLCGNGKSSTPTITGEFNIPSKYPRSHPYFDSGNARCWYPTRIHGGYLFHSVLYYQSGSPSSIMDGRVGIGVSHGCIRLRLDNAKWIYDNIPLNTKVVIY